MAKHYPQREPRSPARIKYSGRGKAKPLLPREQPEFVGKYPVLDEYAPLRPEALLKIIETLIDSRENILLSPMYPREFAKELGLDYDDDDIHELIWDHFRKALYSIQDAKSDWYTPETSGLTIGYGSTFEPRMGDDGRVYFRAIFPESMVVDGKQMPAALEESSMGDRAVYVNMRIDPHNISLKLLNDWLKRLNKHVSGLDQETGTWIGRKGEFEGRAARGEFFEH
ncbi:MAG: hypothetical protein ACHQ03_12045 [Candidatus Bathyarchaeia archaeon]|nr:hypothetical protein [Nitrososphaerota archaeon]